MSNDYEWDKATAGASSEKDPAPDSRPAPYVRQRPARRSVEPIDDFSSEEPEPTYVSDSRYTTRGSALSGGGYRRSRATSKQLRRDLHYGQYLEIPKGRRDIFVSRERRTRIKTAIALIAVLAVLAVVVFFLWEYMQTNWGSTS